MARRWGHLHELDEDEVDDDPETEEWSISGRPQPPDVIPVERTDRNTARNNSALPVSSITAASGRGGGGLRLVDSSGNFDYARTSAARGGTGKTSKKTKTNGYLLYIFHRRKQAERETGEKLEGGLNQAMTKFDAEWKALSEDEKAVWKDKAKQQNERQQ